MSYLGNQPTQGQFRKLTDISGGFNGTTTSFTLSVPPGTVADYVTPVSNYSLIISLNNVIKNPGVDYTVSGYTITFTTAPTLGQSFFGIVCGDPLNGLVPADGSITFAKLSTTGGSVGQTLLLNSSLQFEWGSASTAILAANNTFTGANAFSNTTGQSFTTSTTTQDGIVLKGNANGTTSNRVTIVPANLTGNQTLTLPDASGTVLLSGANISFTGANTFYNASGQTFGTATSTNDGIILAGRAGGASSYRATLTPGTLTASRTFTLPDVNGTFVTTGDTGSVTNTMLAGSISNAKLTNSSITINGSVVSLGGSTTVSASVTNAVTFNNTGAGAVSGSTFDGSSAVTVSYNTLGAVGAAANTTFTGTNSFLNATGQTFGTATSTNDGIVLQGRAGGASSFRSTLIPGTLTASRTLTLPNVSGTIITSGDSGTVTNTMLAANTITVNGNAVSLGGTTTVTANTTNSITFNDTGSGIASNGSFNGSVARTISYNTIGAAGLSASNTFTGPNTFSSTAGQLILHTNTTRDGLLLQPGTTGNSNFRVTITPTTSGLTASRTLYLPDVTGTLVTNTSGSVTNTMIAAGAVTTTKIDSTGYSSGQTLVADGANSTSWQWYAGSLFYRVNTAVVGANTTAAQSVFGVGVTLTASTVYRFTAVYILNKTAGATGHTISVGFGGTATLNNIGYLAIANLGSNSPINATSNLYVTNVQSTANTQVTSSAANATLYAVVKLEGTVSVNASGTFIPQYTLSAAPGGAYSTAIGSYFALTPIGAAGSNSSQGTWA